MITLTDKGLFCEAGGFYIDPSRAVDLAIVTHAHSDHARRGSRQYLCAAPGGGLLAQRIGLKAPIREIAYREKFRLGEVTVSFHPAGHILGSAQVRVQRGSEVWVVSGDYKRDNDPTCEAFEVVKCDTFITEATFGHPKYEWQTSPAEASKQIHEWWEECRNEGRNAVLFAYALGKTQRVLAELAAFTDREAFVFGEAHALTERYREAGVRMIPTRSLETLGKSEKVKGALVVAPHALSSSPWMDRLGRVSTAFASGWMRTGAFGMGRQYDRGFVLSDHADWPSLVRTIEETGARTVLIQHAGEGALTRHLRKLGLKAAALSKATATPVARKETPAQGDLFA